MDLNNRPSCIQELSPQILPSLIMLFQGLQRAYKGRNWTDFLEVRSPNVNSSCDLLVDVEFLASKNFLGPEWNEDT